MSNCRCSCWTTRCEYQSYPIPNPIFCLGAHVLRWLADRNISALSSQQHYRGRSTLPAYCRKQLVFLEFFDASGVLSLSSCTADDLHLLHPPHSRICLSHVEQLDEERGRPAGTIPATSCSPHPWHTAFQEGRPLTSADSSQPPDVRVSQSLRTRGIRTAVVYWSSPQPPQGREPAKTCGNVWTKATTGHPNPHCPYLCLPRLCHS